MNMVDGVKEVVRDSVKMSEVPPLIAKSIRRTLTGSRAKKADKACDGALSDIVREVGVLALEHRE